MHCAKCGYNNLSNARVCAKCGAPLVPAPKRPARARGERKTVQLPSYGATHEKAQRSKPQTREENERPWEARVPARDKRTAQREEQTEQRKEREVQREERIAQREERIAQQRNQAAQDARAEQAQVENTQKEQARPEQTNQIPAEKTQVETDREKQPQVEQTKQAEQVEQAEEAKPVEDEDLKKYRGRFATHVPAKKQPQSDDESPNITKRVATAAAASLASEAGSVKTAAASEDPSSYAKEEKAGDVDQAADMKPEDTDLGSSEPSGTDFGGANPEKGSPQPENIESNAQTDDAEQKITEQIAVESMQGKDDIPDASKAATVIIPATAAVAGTASDATVKMTRQNAAGKEASAAASAKRTSGATSTTQSDDPTIVVKRTSPTQRHAPKKEKNTGKKAIGVVAAIALLACLGIGGWYFTHGTSAKNTVSFDTNGGSSISQQYITENGQLQQPMSPTREGYKFEGWYLDASYNEPAKFPLTITKDITLYAKWVPESQNGVSTSASSSSGSSSSAAAAPADSTVSGVISGGGSSGGTSSGGVSGGSSGGGYISGGSGSGESGGGSGGGTGGSAASDTGDVTTSISVIAADGTTLSGEVHLHDGYVIPDSSDRVYTIDELRALNLSDADLCIAWNEPFARLGHDFDNPGLQNYFDNRSWYSNNFRKASLPPNSAAEINVANLQKLARENGSSAAWLNLRTY